MSARGCSRRVGRDEPIYGLQRIAKVLLLRSFWMRRCSPLQVPIGHEDMLQVVVRGDIPALPLGLLNANPSLDRN